ncbi:hypothetical protein FHS21_004957 [Phyllobacterium trifolii]|uniref:DUF2000 domain-containing protein n=1 Tax=Phyllobacterium trifolii TaxID=300193 RepID=A0A839UIZ6_9HYPH|nr:DUF2000 domain-containing protein [Phyllobacterium trifolii]MBB3148509.1 hypothetical protein [Phyllobacterium trifolii]
MFQNADANEAQIEAARCTIIVDKNLPVGRCANAAAVIALTMGKMHAELTGADLVDGAGFAHPGLIPIGISVLGAAADELNSVREKAIARGLSVVDFPVQGQQTNDYAAFMGAVSQVPTEALSYVGVGVYGPRKLVGKVVGKFDLLT